VANLPTADEMLDNAAAELDKARRALSEARDWLASDWRPLGSMLTDAQVARRDRLREAIAEARTVIDHANRWER
jgi:hypothetical protein